MSFFAMIAKNLLRRPARSLLTSLGIAVGTGAVVALMSLVWGFERAVVKTYEARKADLIVQRVASGRPLPASFSQEAVDALGRFEGVRGAAGLMTDAMSVEDVPIMLVLGLQTGSFLWDHLTLQEGRWPGSDSEPVVLLGALASEALAKRVGDTVTIDTDEVRVCGIFTSTALPENGAVVMPLGRFQALTYEPGMINTAVVALDPAMTAADVARLRDTIRQRMPGLRAFDARQLARSNIAARMTRVMSLATSLIGLTVGAVGVANTMLMSVVERVHEIGVLLAVGWTRRRIVRMIVAESLVISLAGGTAGTAGGLVGLRVLLATRWLRGAIAADVNASILCAVLAGTAALGFVAGLYPAWRAANMQATTALRHE